MATNAKKTITVRQIGSHIGRIYKQEQILIGLGLNKNRREKVLIDTPEVRGMIKKVQHLIEVVEG